MFDSTYDGGGGGGEGGFIIYMIRLGQLAPFSVIVIGSYVSVRLAVLVIPHLIQRCLCTHALDVYVNGCGQTTGRFMESDNNISF